MVMIMMIAILTRIIIRNTVHDQEYITTSGKYDKNSDKIQDQKYSSRTRIKYTAKNIKHDGRFDKSVQGPSQ